MVNLRLHVHPVIANTEQTFFPINNSLNVNNIIFEPLTKIRENFRNVTFMRHYSQLLVNSPSLLN